MIRELDKSKPYIVVDLHPVLEAYCRWIFKPKKTDLGIPAKRSHPIGRALNGHIVYYSKRIQNYKIENPVYFYPAITKYNQSLMEKFYPSLNISMLKSFCDLVDAKFDEWCTIAFSDGYAANLDQLGMVESICDILNIRVNAANFEYITKKDYRSRKDEVRIRTKMVLIHRLSV